MKKSLTAQAIRDSFIGLALITEHFNQVLMSKTYDDDIGTLKSVVKNARIANNKAVGQLIKLYKIYEKDTELAKETLMPLLANESPSVKTWAATHCLVLGISVKKAEEILINATKESGPIGLESKMVLAEWRKGTLRIYQKK